MREQSMECDSRYLNGVELAVGQVEIIIVIDVARDGAVIVTIAAEKREGDGQTDHLYGYHSMVLLSVERT